MHIVDERQETKPIPRQGFAYVHFIHRTSYMLNVTAEEQGVGAGVLLRAIEPLEGINLRKRLGKTEKSRIWREGQDVLRLRLPSTGGWTEWTCAPSVRFGLGLRFEKLRTFAQLYASASRTRLAGCCVSLRLAAPFVSGRSKGEKKSLGSIRFECAIVRRQSQKSTVKGEHHNESYTQP